MSCKASANVTIADISDGTDGTGIASTKVEYQAGSSGTSAPTGTWKTTVDSTSAEKPYLWTRVTYTYTDGRTPLEVFSVGSTPEGIEVGGTQILPNTKSMTGYSLASNVTVANDAEGFAVATFSAVSTLAWNAVWTRPPILFSKVRGRTVTFSLWVRSDEYEQINADNSIGLHIAFGLCTGTSTTRTLYGSRAMYTTQLSNSWTKVSLTAKLSDSYFNSGSGTIDNSTRLYIQAYNRSTYSMQMKKFKLEFGNKATDWTPAPEDVDSKIEEAQTTANNAQLNIDSANARIDTLVTRTDSLGQSLTSVTQTADKINWLVESGTSSSNFTLTDRTATLIANTINLNGNVKVNGDMLVDGCISTNKLSANAVTTAKLATDAIRSTNYSYSSGNYSSAGTFLDLSTGLIRSKNFAINSSGDAYFKGTITATGGKIGSFNINSSLYTNSNTLNYTGSDSNIYLGSDGIGFGRSYLTSTGGMSLQGYGGTTGQIEGGNISLFASNGGDNPYLEATAGTSLTNSYLILRCPTTLNSTLTANSGLTVKNAGVELYFSTPFIDFHFNNSTSDYTSRIIEKSSGVLTMTSSLTVEKTATISGGRLYVEGLGRKVGLAAQDADKVGLYDYTNSKWLIYSENDSSEPIKINTKLSVGTYSNSDYAISCSSFICEGWVRTKTGRGWYNEDHGGGWYMSDNTWIRSYGSKSIYQDSGTLRTDGTLQVGSDGAYFKSNSTNTTIKTLLFEDFSGTNRRPASSASGDGSRVAYLSSGGSTYLTVSGQWGTTGSTYSTKKFTVASSDIRLKENISDTSIDALSVINQIRIRQFDWRRDHSHQVIGMVADEVELIDSKFSIGGGYDDEGNMDEKIVDTFYMMGYVVKGIQEICSADNKRDEKIQSNEARVNSLQTQLNEAMEQIAELKKLVELLTA